MSACPECGHVVADGDVQAEVAHMKAAHPDVIEERLVAAGLAQFEQGWPKIAPAPAEGDVVQVLMTEQMARSFEERCLADSRLSPPLLFCEDDLPTYTIGPR